MKRVAIASALLMGACQEYEVQSKKDVVDGAAPDILLTPTALQYGPTASADAEVQHFTIENIGGSTLHVSDMRFESGGDAFALLTPTLAMDLAVGETADIDVRFQPMVSDNFGRLLVVSDDPDLPEAPVDLLGIGEVPELDITPDFHTFPVACDDAVEVKLENVGLEPLTIDSISYNAPGDLTLVDSNVLPLTLDPGTYTTVNVQYAPTGIGNAVGTLTVDSNDPRGVQEANQEAEPAAGDTVIEEFEVIADPPIDILFAIDKSGSMTEEARALSGAVDNFMVEIATATQDWQIGVVTKDNGCFNNGIITPTTPYFESVFDGAVTGIQVLQTDLTEALLELSYNALTQTQPGACNNGFVRYGAVLHLILVSDEPDQSSQAWDWYINEFRARMWDPQMLVVSVVVDKFGSCGSGAAGYLESAADTGGLVLDVCNSNWGVYAADLGNASSAAVQSYVLAATPDETTIEVAVDGTVYSNGWHYDAARNAVVIDVDLPEGSTVTVTYTQVGC